MVSQFCRRRYHCSWLSLLKSLSIAACLATPLLSGCKTLFWGVADNQLKDFNDDAAQNFHYDSPYNYAFCPQDTHFNIVNGYWLAVAANYVYADENSVKALAADLRKRWHASDEFFSNPTPKKKWEPSSQALWLEMDSMVILAFRGTQIGAYDIATDMDLSQAEFEDQNPGLGKVHKGFKDGLAVIWHKNAPGQDLYAKLRSLSGTTKPLFITGHSLGAALASLTTAHILLDADLASIRPLLRGLYTYGSPRVGDETFYESFNRAKAEAGEFPVARFRNNADVVTRIPSSRLYPQYAYQGLGTLYYFDDLGELYADPQPDPNYQRLAMPNFIAENMVENLLDYKGRNFTTKYRDHAISGYIQDLVGEYLLTKNWAGAHHASLCDMGLYKLARTPPPTPSDDQPWTNDSATTTARQDQGITVRDCCVCVRTWYTSNWGFDQAFKKENLVSPIQEGDFATGNCPHPGGKEEGALWWQQVPIAFGGKSYDQYYVYSGCRKVSLVGEQCLAGKEIWADGVRSGKSIKDGTLPP